MNKPDSPYLRAAAVYDNEPCDFTFKEDLEMHLMCGFVFSTPDYFIMGRPVIKGADIELITDPTYEFERELCNCWHVYLFAGDMSKSFDILPWSLEWLSMERNNEMRYLKMDILQRILTEEKEKE
tara:strand:+ start:753 stop:1127 length:375 start_codon:yes stop_codon:yes gene_type:complete